MAQRRERPFCYDIEQAVDDSARSLIYDGWQTELHESERSLDEEFDEATEGEEVARKERLKAGGRRREPIVGGGRGHSCRTDLEHTFGPPTRFNNYLTANWQQVPKNRPIWVPGEARGHF